MPCKNPAIRRAVNQIYYARAMQDPAKREARRRKENARRKANPNIRDQKIAYYERNRELVIFKERLWRMLLTIRTSEIARGRVPYDG